MMPIVSIIIPLYNKEKHIKDTLKSVLNQSFQDFEVIIVNDGSTDRSELEASSVKDERITIYTIKNQGVSFARNFGVSKMATNLAVLLDADDLWMPHHLQDLMALHTNYPNCGMYATAYARQYEGSMIHSEYYNIPPNYQGIVQDFFAGSSITCIAHSSAVMIPKEVYKSLGGFNTAYDAGEDTDFWIRIALHYPVAFNSVESVLIQMEAENKATNTNINLKNQLNLEAYLADEKTNPSLKKYLDLNRFSIAIQHKIAGNNDKANELIKNIDFQNLNEKQRFLLQLNSTALRLMMQFKKKLRDKGIGLGAFG